MEQIELPYQVRVEGVNFEGPLDLLLHLIRKNEVNIYDIPIALITQQYLDYLSVMKSLNLAVAGEFLVMAATLVQIKSKMLLPVDEREQDEEDGPDPREELVRRLLEYKTYKEAAGQLDNRERLWREIFRRDQGPMPSVRRDEELLEDLTLFDLVDTLQDILARTPDRRLLEITPESLTVKDRMNAILEALENKESFPFVDLFEGVSQRLVIIVTFLALLELIRISLVRVFQAETFGPILLTRAFSRVNPDEAVDV
jgi:segregation and condensation protein A